MDSFNSSTAGEGHIQPWSPPKSRPTGANPVDALPVPYGILMSNQKRLFGDIFSGGGWPTVGTGETAVAEGATGGGGSSTQWNIFPQTSGQHRGFGGHVW